jgi:hypothetical protein
MPLPSLRRSAPAPTSSHARRSAVSRKRGRRTLPTRILASAVTALLVSSPAAHAQAVDDRLVPSGSVRASAWPSFTAWDERFGPRGGRAPLGEDLTAGSALAVFPGSSALVEGLRALSGNGDYTPTMGSVEGRVSHDVTRIDLGLHLGVTDWWTVGVTVPRIKNRTAVDLVFVPDTVGGDLGVSPYVTARAEVDAFLGALGSAASSAAARADALCAAMDPECASATALAERAGMVDAGMARAYRSTPFFPLEGSAIGASLIQAVSELDAALADAGLLEVGAPLVLAEERATESDLATLPTRFDVLGYAAPLRTRTTLWSWGDIEIATYARVLEVERGARSLEVIAGGLVRLGTGTAASPDVPLDLGAGDGQTDAEGRLAAYGTLGPLSIRLGGLYGLQGARALTRRVAGPDASLAPAETRVTVDWDPGSYRTLDLEPGIRLASELILSGAYRYFGKSADVYRLRGEGGSADPIVLPSGVGASRHEIGGSLTYDTVDRSRAGEARPFRFRIRLLRAVAGRGTHMPASTRVDLGAELFTSLWGG